MGLLGSLNCFSSAKKSNKNRRTKKQKQQQRNGSDDGGEQLLVSPLSFTSSSTSKTTSTISTSKVNSSSSKKPTSLSTNLVCSSPPPSHTLLVGGTADDNSSIPTIDSTYNKFNSQFSLSDAGGTTGSHQQQSLGTSTLFGGGNNVSNFWPMSPLSPPFGAVTSPGLSPFGQVLSPGVEQQQLLIVPPPKQHMEEYTIIYAPSGVLGVVIDTPSSSSSSNSNTNNNSSSSNSRMTSSGRPIVHAIKDTCPIRKDIHVGDILVAVDDIDVTAMTAVEVSQLISKKSMQEQRKLTLIRSSSIGGSGSRLHDRRR